jgi:pyridoxine 5-phosphate synthase
LPQILKNEIHQILTKLSVNVNKIATLRNSRGTNLPDVCKVALDIERFGADGITVHPRPDERHIKRADVYALKNVLKTELNVEGYPSRDFIEMVCEVKPAQVTLVPDEPGALTSNSGWDCIKFGDFLKEIICEIKKHGPEVSIFLNPDPAQAHAAAATGTDRIELYTEAYSRQYHNDKFLAIKPYIAAAEACHQLGLGINAGHDLNLENLAFLQEQIPYLNEVSIGHALVCDALYFGLQNTVMMYKRLLSYY